MNLVKKQTIMEPIKNQASIEVDETGDRWAVCPHCGKKAIKLLPETRVSMLPYICRNNKCPVKKFIINCNTNLCLI